MSGADRLAREPWLYWRVFCGGPEWMDAGVREALVPAAAVLDAEPAVERWFFLRYVEERGPHLRLRARVRPEAIDTVQTAVDERLELGLAALAEAPGGRAALLLEGASPALGGGRLRALDRALYEPELEKFGGPDGIVAAERAFLSSSRLALEAVLRTPRSRERVRLASGIMVRLAAVVAPESPPALWTRYAEVWSGARKPGREGILDRLSRPAARLAHELAATADPAEEDPVLGALSEQHIRAVTDCLAAAGGRKIPRTMDLAFQLFHLTNNRLGLAPLEEALVALALAGPADG